MKGKLYSESMQSKLPVIFLLSALIALLPITTPYMWVASLAYILMITGMIVRKRNRRLHAYSMGLAMLIDVSLVLILEIQRDAVATAIGFTLGPWQQAHIAASTVALCTYIPIAILGLKQYRSGTSSTKIRYWHATLGITAFTFRTLGFLLMFSMIKS